MIDKHVIYAQLKNLYIWCLILYFNCEMKIVAVLSYLEQILPLLLPRTFYSNEILHKLSAYCIINFLSFPRRNEQLPEYSWQQKTSSFNNLVPKIFCLCRRSSTMEINVCNLKVKGKKSSFWYFSHFLILFILFSLVRYVSFE